MLRRSPLFQRWGRDAIRADRKRQTRRLLTRSNTLVDGHPPTAAAWSGLDLANAWLDPGPSPAGNEGPYLKAQNIVKGTTHRLYPRVQPGDVWAMGEPLVKMWGDPIDDESPSHLAQYGDGGRVVPGCWWLWERNTLSTMHMPKKYARTFLLVTDVRAERVQDISEADAVAEGAPRKMGCTGDMLGYLPVEGSGNRIGTTLARDWFRDLWDSINGKKPGCAWADNPWNFAHTFRLATPAEVEAAAEGDKS